MSLSTLYRKYTPIQVRSWISELREAGGRRQAWKAVQRGEYESTYPAECAYMRNRGEISTFPYAWSERYQCSQIETAYDEKEALPYAWVYVDGKKRKLFFPEKWGAAFIRKYLNTILQEQDEQSPHFYFHASEVDGCLLCDIGAAEGYISLSVIDYVKEAVLFECDPIWKRPLEATFRDYGDKVRIINQYVSDGTSENTTSLDTFLSEKETEKVPIVIKADVEGSELRVLQGAKEVLMHPDTKVFICACHHEKDQEELTGFLEKQGFQVSTSDSRLFYRFPGDAGYSFRAGVLRAQK